MSVAHLPQSAMANMRNTATQSALRNARNSVAGGNFVANRKVRETRSSTEMQTRLLPRRHARFEDQESLTVEVLREELSRFERKIFQQLQNLTRENALVKARASQACSSSADVGGVDLGRELSPWPSEEKTEEKRTSASTTLPRLVCEASENDADVNLSLDLRKSSLQTPKDRHIVELGKLEDIETLRSARDMRRYESYNKLNGHDECEEEPQRQWTSEAPDLMSASSPQEFVTALVMHHVFSIIVSTLIAVNCGLIGWEVDFAAKNPGASMPHWYAMVDSVFCFLFSVEILLRLYAHRGDFVRMPGWLWNVFDTVVVLMQIMDTVPSLLAWTQVQFDLTFIRVLRIIRITRIVRVMRLLNSVEELRMLVMTICSSLRTLFWVLLLLFLVLYAFSVLLTTLVTEQLEGLKAPRDPRNVETLRTMFGSLLATMLTLYQSICSGLSWRDAVAPMQRERISPLLPLAFVLYIAIMVFALLNVITGVVLTSSVQAAEVDRQKVIVDQMKQVFQEADGKNVGTICSDEFDEQLYEPALQAALNSIAISVDDARELFALLADKDSQQRVHPDDFIEACLRWCAPAKKIDYAFLQREISLLGSDLKDDMQAVNELSLLLKAEVNARTN